MCNDFIQAIKDQEVVHPFPVRRVFNLCAPGRHMECLDFEIMVKQCQDNGLTLEVYDNIVITAIALIILHI